MIKNIQGKIKESGRGFGLLLAKVFSGLLLGLTFALIFKQLTSIGSFIFTFIIVLFVGVFITLSQKWKFTGVLLFNLFCVMTAMLLRMYICSLPGNEVFECSILNRSPRTPQNLKKALAIVEETPPKLIAF